MAERSPSTSSEPHIDAREFDRQQEPPPQRHGHHVSLLEDDAFVTELSERVQDRDRAKMKRLVLRYISFAVAVACCLCAGSIAGFSLYGPRFLTHLRYTQYRVNAVSITAELAMYLPVPLFGYLCDRYSPPPLAFLSACLFGAGYTLAAFVYRSGPPADAIGHIGKEYQEPGMPFVLMIVAFIGIGAGTSCMYLAAVATCAKNFAKAKYRGFMLAVPIACFGLSGMWQAQVGAHLLQESNGSGQVDVFRYFIFLACLLFGVGMLGTLALRVIDEEELIEGGVENLEQSGLLDSSEFFRPTLSRRATSQSVAKHSHSNYGTMANHPHREREHWESDTEDSESSSILNLDLTHSAILRKQEESQLLKEKKSWLLNHAIHTFLTDKTMYLLAAGFLLLAGPGEAYINNVGTIIPSLAPSPTSLLLSSAAGTPSTHVSVIALTSTIARLLTGSLSDLFAPPSQPTNPPSTRFSMSRLLLLLPSTCLLLVAFVSLSIPSLVPSHPSLFPYTSALLGFGYGAAFSLVPIIISVVWGAQNFATNWGVVAMMPAFGAGIWQSVFSVVYASGAAQDGSEDGSDDELCTGYKCYGSWAVGCTISVAAAIMLWAAAWRVWRRRRVVV